MVLFAVVQVCTASLHRPQPVLHHPQRSRYFALVLAIANSELAPHLIDRNPAHVMRLDQSLGVRIKANHCALDNHRIQWIDDERWRLTWCVVLPPSLDTPACVSWHALDAPHCPVLNTLLNLNAHVSQYQVIPSR